VAGLVAITPAAGFVNVVGALIIGLIAGIIPYFMVAIVKRRLGYDDALDVFGIHGIGGILGAILTGVFADPSVNELGRGLIYENPIQLIIQPFAVSVVIVYDAIVTLLILLIIKIFVGLRVKHDDEITGLDESQHGESAYNVT
jgi:Amt family ammonium transporter